MISGVCPNTLRQTCGVCRESWGRPLYQYSTGVHLYIIGWHRHTLKSYISLLNWTDSWRVIVSIGSHFMANQCLALTVSRRCISYFINFRYEQNNWKFDDNSELVWIDKTLLYPSTTLYACSFYNIILYVTFIIRKGGKYQILIVFCYVLKIQKCKNIFI